MIGMHGGDGGDADGRYCQRKACAMWTEALPKDGVTEMEKMPMDGVTEAKVKTKAEAETRPMEAHVTETKAMPMDGVTETKAEAECDANDRHAWRRRWRCRRRCQWTA